MKKIYEIEFDDKMKHLVSDGSIKLALNKSIFKEGLILSVKEVEQKNDEIIQAVNRVRPRPEIEESELKISKNTFMHDVFKHSKYTISSQEVLESLTKHAMQVYEDGVKEGIRIKEAEENAKIK